MQRITSFVLAVIIFASAAVSALFVLQAIRSEQSGVNDDLASQLQESNQDEFSQQEVNENMIQGKPLENFSPTSERLTELKIEDIVVGDGAEAQSGATVTVHYTGATMADGIIFESSLDKGETISFGLEGLIQGWQDGIPGMKVGGKRRLLIPASQAYGDTGSVSGDLVFDIELFEVR